MPSSVNIARRIAHAPTPWLYDDRLRMGGVKFYADGALGSRGAWLKRPYTDKPDTRGLQFHDDAEILAAAEPRGGSTGFQVAIHAIGDAANAQVIGDLRAAGAATTAGPPLADRAYPDRRSRRHSAPRHAGIIASMQPTHQTSDRLMAEKRLGPERLDGRLCLADGDQVRRADRVRFRLPGRNPQSLPRSRAAISRQDLDGQPPGGWRPQERVSFEQALAGFYPRRGVCRLRRGPDRRLEPGKWADFILVDRDPSKVDRAGAGADRGAAKPGLAGRRC